MTLVQPVKTPQSDPLYIWPCKTCKKLYQRNYDYCCNGCGYTYLQVRSILRELND